MVGEYSKGWACLKIAEWILMYFPKQWNAPQCFPEAIEAVNVLVLDRSGDSVEHFL